MSLMQLAIIVGVAVLILAPIWIYILSRYSDLNKYQQRFRRSNPHIFWRDNRNDGDDQAC